MMSRTHIVPGRDLVMLVMLVLGFSLLIGRAAHLQVFSPDDLQAEGNARYLRNEKINAYRGLIKDRNGETLAVSTPVDSAWAEPRILIKHEERWEDLSRELGIPESEIEANVRKLSDQNRQFMYLRRHLTAQDAKRVSELEIPGVSLMREYRRFYPHGPITANLIGFTNIDDIGLEGIELSLNSSLQGNPGLKRVIKDRLGRTVETVSHVRPVRDGDDVHLSIDSRIQQVAFRELLAVLTKERATLATSVVVHVPTGEILALATAPSFNPNVLSERRVTRNNAVTDVFEPGSIAKPFVVANAIMKGIVTPQTLIDTSPGYMHIDGYTVEDIRNFGIMTVSDVVMKSSNVGVIKIGTQIDPDEMVDFYRSMGFGSLTGSGISGEDAGLFPNRDFWRISEHATLSYGYGFAVTALQIVQAYSAIANDGVLVPLTIIADQQTRESRQVLPRHIAAELHRMLERVVSPQGTSRRAKISLYRVAGKSATVQKLINGRYSSEQHLAMFVGFAPVSDPQLAAVVIVDDPRTDSHYGGAVAAPAFRRIMSAALRILDVPPDDLDRLVKHSPASALRAES